MACFTDYLPQAAITMGMYEGPIHAADYAGSDETPILRQLRWTDLVARIAATRETRPTAIAAFEESHGSFTAFHRESGPEGQQRINRDALTHGKLSRIITPDAANNAGDGDREIP
ncbi:MAG: hypothetical protein EOP59_20065 [Sphingomonadales bacterium]|nr:MAG: hypothetical protein EOP59_20065 [Sphingomonadales bacterium]